MATSAAVPPGVGQPAPGGLETVRLHDQAQYLLDNIRWMVGLRWIAIAGIAIGLVVAYAIQWTAPLAAPALTAAALAASNFLVWHRYRHAATAEDPAALQRQIVLHLHLDLAALSLVLHWTGGVVNPFVTLFAFPAATGAILLGTRAALLVGTTTFLLFAAMVVCDIVSASPRPFEQALGRRGDLLEHPAYFVALIGAVSATLFGIVYLLRTVVNRHEQAEERRRNHERIALSRERMARVGMIAAGVAHSVRNPLHGVLNCLDLVRDSGSKQEAEQTLALMQEGLSRIEQVTSRLLSLSRETPIAPQAVDLDQLVVDTLRLLEVRFAQEGIELRVQLGGLRDARADPTRLHEALFNILDNARAAVAELPPDWGEKRVEVRTSAIDAPFRGFCIEVRDSGIGVYAAALPHVFDPFFSTKPVGEGTGLGLAIAKEVVEAHGGIVQFASQRNSGTNVRILIPSDARAPLGGAAP
ncbi:MAG: hypothetical protein FJ265_10495 [Planctomycetes bacterium]|nr:hypothetical protein [Planctomycetota bacterium]